MGLRGTVAAPGAAGCVWWEGTGAPNAADGVNADFYLNTTNGDVYSKSSGSWTLDGNIRGPAGPAGPSAIGAPVARTVAFATAYQASDPTKPSLVQIIVDLAGSVAIGTVANTVQLITGPTNAVAGGTGDLVDSWRNDLTVTLITITITARQKLTAFLPIGYYFAVRRTVGTGMTIASAFDQTVG